jgi:hypothetical protein
MSYDPPPDCATCHHLAVLHRDWWTNRPKDCITHRDGKRCDCKTYVRSTT